MSKAQFARATLLGAGLMYFLDPVRGGRRRADLSGRVSHVLRLERELFERAKRDAENRIRGIVDQLRAPVAHQVPDEVLEPRVRSRLGHCISHPRAVLVDVVDGHVTLAGPILAHEADHLVAEIATIRGVKEVLDALDRHKTAEGIPGLQGEERAVRRRPTLWSPINQLMAVTAGSYLLAWGILVRRGVVGGIAAIAGGALATRGTLNRPLGQLVRGGVVRKHRPRPDRQREASAHILH